MTWEEFLAVTIDRCGLEGAVKEFFKNILSEDGTCLDLSPEELAVKLGYGIKTCEAHLSKIYRTVGKGKDLQKK
ncbi:MAG: hypothetical protein MUC48_24865, partial [Leptolyngbya sp. Prado105]|nr:hypothetical protein [Leptolyngbya sp. Prado105]